MTEPTTDPAVETVIQAIARHSDEIYALGDREYAQAAVTALTDAGALMPERAAATREQLRESEDVGRQCVDAVLAELREFSTDEHVRGLAGDVTALRAENERLKAIVEAGPCEVPWPAEFLLAEYTTHACRCSKKATPHEWHTCGECDARWKPTDSPTEADQLRSQLDAIAELCDWTAAKGQAHIGIDAIRKALGARTGDQT